MENAANIPKGFYEDDCGGCTFDENTRMLTCKKCFNARGVGAESSLEVKEGCVVVLDNGVLKCRVDEETENTPTQKSDDQAEKREL